MSQVPFIEKDNIVIDFARPLVNIVRVEIHKLIISGHFGGTFYQSFALGELVTNALGLELGPAAMRFTTGGAATSMSVVRRFERGEEFLHVTFVTIQNGIVVLEDMVVLRPKLVFKKAIPALMFRTAILFLFWWWMFTILLIAVLPFLLRASLMLNANRGIIGFVVVFRGIRLQRYFVVVD
jgi:hypothetical protein